MTRFEALQLAASQELDLVEVSPMAEPPVCRIIDFGKFLFEQNKKSHAAKKKQKQIQVKEVKFRPGTDEGDYQIKLRNLIRFFEEGDKAKVTLRFRGREMAHTDLGRQLLIAVAERPRGVRGGRAAPADGRPADGHDARAEKEVRAASGRPSPSIRGFAGRGETGYKNQELMHAQVEDQPGRGQAFSQDGERLQARPVAEATHPHQEDEQA